MATGIKLDERLLTILLEYNTGRVVSLKYLAEELGVTTRSIRNYIKDLNDIISDMGEIRIAGSGVFKLHITNKKKLDEFVEENIRQGYSFNSKGDRARYIISTLLSADDYVKIDDLSETICVSRTTINKDIALCESILEDYEIGISRKQNKGMRLVGSEINLRIMLINYILKDTSRDIYETEYLGRLDAGSVEVYRRRLHELFKESDYNITSRAMENLIIYSAVAINRIRDSRLIEEYDYKYNLIRGSMEYVIGERVYEIMREIFSIEEYSEGEQIFITVPLAASNATIDIHKMDDSVINPRMMVLVGEILNKIFISTGARIKDTRIKKNLARHITYTLNRLIFNITHKNELLEEIKTNYKYSYELATIAAGVIEKRYGLKVNDDEIGFIAIHFMNYQEYKSDAIKEISRVLLVCDSGIGSAMLISTKLKRVLHDNIKIDMCSSFELGEYDLDSYDVIFTTVDINLKDYVDSSSSGGFPILKIDTIFDENIVKRNLENVLYMRGLATRGGGIDFELLENAISEKNFYIFDKEYDIYDILVNMIDDMIEHSQADEAFRKAIIERERVNPTVVGNGLMMPHCVNNTSENLFLSVGIPKNPVYKDNSLIKLIIMTSFPNGEDVDADFLVEIYEEIIKVGQDRRLVDIINQCRSYDEFLKLIDNIKKGNRGL